MSEQDFGFDDDGSGSSSRMIPVNELELAMLTTNPAWGKEATPELNEKLSEIRENVVVDTEGNEFVPKEQLWGLLSFYSRDTRLGNLGSEDYSYARKYMLFAGDCLMLGYVKSFMVSLSRAISVLELSQSKGGFMRKRLNTSSFEHTRMELSPKKRKWGGKNNGGDLV